MQYFVKSYGSNTFVPIDIPHRCHSEIAGTSRGPDKYILFFIVQVQPQTCDHDLHSSFWLLELSIFHPQ